MENLIPKDLMLNSSSEPSPNPQQDVGTQPAFFQKNFENTPFNINPQSNEPIGTIESPKINPKDKMLKKLDDFIQGCLHKYKPVENPDKSLYENTTEKDQDSIISRKSTIPDLVIWNKKFNKNDCFYGVEIEKENDFPRFTFFLRLGNKDKGGKNKNEKNKNKEKKNKKNKKNKKDKNQNQNQNQNNINKEDIKEGINNITKDMNNLNLNKEKSDNINNNNNLNNNNKENKTKKEKKKKNNNKNKTNKKNNEAQNKFNNFNPNNIPNNKYDNINLNNNFYNQNLNSMQPNNNQINNFNPLTMNNKFSMNSNNNTEDNMNNINNNMNNHNYQNERNKNFVNFMASLIKYYSVQKGWLIVNKDLTRKIGNYNSLELFQFLLINQGNFNNFSIIPANGSYIFSCDDMFKFLNKLIPLIYNNNQNDFGQMRENQMNQNNANNINKNNNYIINNNINNNMIKNNIMNNNNMMINNNNIFGNNIGNQNNNINNTNYGRFFPQSNQININMASNNNNINLNRTNSNNLVNNPIKNNNSPIEYEKMNINFFQNNKINQKTINENNMNNEFNENEPELNEQMFNINNRNNDINMNQKIDFNNNNNNNNFNSNMNNLIQANYLNNFQRNQKEEEPKLNNYQNSSINSNMSKNNGVIENYNININNYYSDNIHFNQMNNDNNDNLDKDGNINPNNNNTNNNNNKKKSKDKTNNINKNNINNNSYYNSKEIDKIIFNQWKGAEAFHYYMLCQTQLYNKKFKDACKTSLRLTLYEKELGSEDVYRLIALCSFLNKCYTICSKALCTLEKLNTIKKIKREKYENLSKSIFAKYERKNNNEKFLKCPNNECKQIISEYDIYCKYCGLTFSGCVLTGASIIDHHYYKCKLCHHKTKKNEVKKSTIANCPLCHCSLGREKK